MTGAHPSDRAGGPTDLSRDASQPKALIPCAARLVERLLGSSVLALVCFAVLSMKLIYAAGFQFDEWVLCMILYINFSTKIENLASGIEARSDATGTGAAEGESPAPKGGDAQ